MKKGLVILFLLLSIFACNKHYNKHKSNFSTYNVADSIKVKFKDTVKIHSLARIENKFVCIDFLTRTNIILFDDNGIVLSSYNKRGKGPGEILYAQNLTVSGDSIFVIDSNNKKLLIFNLINDKINYLNEFKIDSNSIGLVKLNKDKILISHLGANNNISLYKNAKMINKYSVNIKKNIKNLEDFLSTGILIRKFPNSENLVMGGLTTGDLTFFKFNENDSLIVLKKTKIKHKIIQKPEVETDNEKKEKTINIDGIRSIQCIGNISYISTQDLSIIHSFEVYDKEGNYKGLSKVVDVRGEIFYFIFSNNADTLWFTKKDVDNTIYIAKKIK